MPGKNIKSLAGKPLICYSIDAARSIAPDQDICVSTDDDAIIKIAEDYGLNVPFKRPAELSTDTAGSYEVVLHALDFYEKKGNKYDCVVLLQPTSPFRKPAHIIEAMELFSKDIDMIVSVKEASKNPFYNLFKEDENEFLSPIMDTGATRRQDAPMLYEYNGSIYIMNVKSLRESSINNFSKVKKYVMDKIYSVDIDDEMDWNFCEFLLNKYTYLKAAVTKQI